MIQNMFTRNGENNKAILDLIKASLWETEVKTASWEEFKEMRIQAVAALPATILSRLNLDAELRKEWRNTILEQLMYHANYIHEQERLPISVPYVILKGTAAAQYYPHPEYRKMGDIDIITRREDFDSACKGLLENGYVEFASKIQEDFGRHRGFVRNGIEVEVHAFFALLNDPKQAEYLDDLIIKNINPSHILPDLVNGLVLLEHIAQHMEGGLGLRQIIDWMMFVNNCLPDKQWPEFQRLTQNIGLEKLAIISTRMCELYLGLPERSWCKDADEMICKKLMDYVLSCGNFGIKHSDNNKPGTSVLSNAQTPFAFVRLLQERGLVNWKAAQEHHILRPFAWLYQIVRYLNKGLARNNALSEIKEEYLIAKERIAFFDLLGVKQTSKGLAVYRDGKYKKTYMRP